LIAKGIKIKGERGKERDKLIAKGIKIEGERGKEREREG
jgi:hypothetical protein